ncbi:hypothetical protein POM88_037297 [Heracleum sosnowskyi]|uniref:Uncharacterized protein n=1 Tax=Heracleum sosnowskyi TaxID=360622 RepID=A0AAD8MD62_9APIA|nr:hypothetical protein POM88_037297 [Heracleum sosnowskyi]
MTEVITVSWPICRPSDRNREKRFRQKLNRKAKREEALRLAPIISRGGLLNMFVRLYHHSRTYILYRIHDPLEHSDIGDEFLMPLLVFEPDVLSAGFCALVHIGPFLYFVGEKLTDVFKILKNDISNLVPGPNNLGFKYLRPLKTHMQGPKKNPLVFVANDDLYVISRSYSCESLEFEMYSPHMIPREIAASPHSRCNESVKDSFMRPTLAPDHVFWTKFNRGFDYIRDAEQHRSPINYMPTFHTEDDKNLLCCVSYRISPTCIWTNVLFTFFKIPGGSQSTTLEEEEVARDGDDIP